MREIKHSSYMTKKDGVTQCVYLNREGRAQFITTRGYKQERFLVAEVKDTDGSPLKRKGWNIWHYGTGMLATSFVFPNNLSAHQLIRLVLSLTDEGAWNFNFDWRDFNAAEDVGNRFASPVEAPGLLMKDVFRYALTIWKLVQEERKQHERSEQAVTQGAVRVIGRN
jgi:hypothetical protein